MNNKENIKNFDNDKDHNDINIKTKNDLKQKENKIGNGKTEVSKDNTENESEKLSQSLKNLLILDKDFAEPVIVKKENELFTDFHYATFKNGYGENTCYINVILHLLYNIEQLEEYITTIYAIDESNKIYKINNPKSYNNNNKEENNDTYKLLVLIGKILSQYKDIIYKEDNDKLNYGEKNDKQVTIINTLKMRKMLEKVSKGKFPLNTIADPVEFFSFILDILNNYTNEDIHKTFYLDLVDEYFCDKKECSKINNKYDKDNFMYHIYIDEILKYIEKENIKVNDYKNKLFEFSHNLFLSENIKICENCKGKMNHNLIRKNSPDYILINCVWKESNPIVDDAMTIFFMMPLKDEFNNLFICQNKTYKKNYYYFFGFVLYSFTLSHYVICIYNLDKNAFVLLNDETVKEFHNLYELLCGISVDILQSSGKAFFYPVMLIYSKDILYRDKIIKLNTLNDRQYKNIINECNEAIYQYEMENKMNDEIKSNNYEEFIKSQLEIEEEIKRRAKYDSYNKLKEKKNENKFEKENKLLKQKLNFEKETTKIEDGKNVKFEVKNNANNNMKEGLEQKNISKISQILKDMKKANGKNVTDNLYIPDFIKAGEEMNKEKYKRNNQTERAYNNERNPGQNIDNNRKIRNNYLYQSNIIWNSKGGLEKNFISNKENEKNKNINNNNEVKIIDTPEINISKKRFHRRTESDLKDSNNNIFNEKKTDKEIDLILSSDVNKYKSKKYYFNYQQKK